MTKSELIARLAERYPQLVAKTPNSPSRPFLTRWRPVFRAGSRLKSRFRQFRSELPSAARRPATPSRAAVWKCQKSTCHTSGRQELRERVDAQVES